MRLLRTRARFVNLAVRRPRGTGEPERTGREHQRQQNQWGPGRTTRLVNTCKIVPLFADSSSPLSKLFPGRANPPKKDKSRHNHANCWTFPFTLRARLACPLTPTTPRFRSLARRPAPGRYFCSMCRALLFQTGEQSRKRRVSVANEHCPKRAIPADVQPADTASLYDCVLSLSCLGISTAMSPLPPFSTSVPVIIGGPPLYPEYAISDYVSAMLFGRLSSRCPFPILALLRLTDRSFFSASIGTQKDVQYIAAFSSLHCCVRPTSIRQAFLCRPCTLPSAVPRSGPTTPLVHCRPNALQPYIRFCLP